MRWPWAKVEAEPEPEAGPPSPVDLYRQAGGDRAEYRRLLMEHGLIIPPAPGEAAEPLPCGWPGTANGTGGTGNYEGEER